MHQAFRGMSRVGLVGYDEFKAWLNATCCPAAGVGRMANKDARVIWRGIVEASGCIDPLPPHQTANVHEVARHEAAIANAVLTVEHFEPNGV